MNLLFFFFSPLTIVPSANRNSPVFPNVPTLPPPLQLNGGQKKGLIETKPVTQEVSGCGPA